MVQKKKDDGLTPMMRQFYSFKEANPDALLLFRCGDFYETYADDAVEAAKILGITLTRRSNGKNANGAACEMAGFPYHALDTYLPKLHPCRKARCHLRPAGRSEAYEDPRKAWRYGACYARRVDGRYGAEL